MAAMAAASDTLYISTSCNRTPGCVSWGYNNLICFGACNSVAIYDPQERKVIRTYAHHSARVNCVKWIPTGEGKHEFEFLSGSSDKTVALWAQGSCGSFSVLETLTGHDDAVTVVDGIYLDSKNVSMGNSPILVASSSADGTVQIWKRSGPNRKVKKNQNIKLKNGLCLSLKLCLLPEACVPLLAVAADDTKIYLYSCKNCEEDLHVVHRLVGHEDWVRSIDITFHDNGNILVASAGQDTLIRIWRLSPREAVEKQADFLSKREIRLEEDLFSVEGYDRKYLYAATLDSVLAGHEGWVYEICWHPRIFKDSSITQPLCLLSASLDKSMVLWSPESEVDGNGIWLEQARVGEVGGNTLGFYGCQYSPDGNSILAHGYLGSFHLWRKNENNNSWLPDVTVGGHFDAVSDAVWEPGGMFLISVSADQTSRLHAPWMQQNKIKATWHELARPQVHGYDMQCLAVISRYKFASGAEEKVVRVFQAPANFIENFHSICGVEGCLTDELMAEAPLGASVPSLGLSNKAVYGMEADPPTGNQHPKDEFPEAYFTPTVFLEPPKEEDLMQNTLWPEIQKLYGHGYEIYSLAASHDGKLLASACKATTPQHASVILWSSETWQQIQKLESHELTVTQLAFAPNDNFLLSVSRDRRWSLFKRCEEDSLFMLYKSTNKSCGVHTRIIWCCAWTYDSKFFSTGSREGKVAIWGGNDCIKSDCSLGLWCPASEPLTLKESVTSLAFSPDLSDGRHILAAGLENGFIHLLSWVKGQTGNWVTILTLDQHMAHHLAVKRLSFRPAQSQIKEYKNHFTMELASAGADHAVKIHAINFN